MTQIYSISILKLHLKLKCLSKCHVIIGLILLILSILADYVSYRLRTVRMHGLAECCSFYFILTGVIGVCGSASHRRGLIIAFMIMLLHICIIFSPIIIIASSFDIHFYRRECWGECDWHLFASIPPNSKCHILCGNILDSNLKISMTRLGTDYRIDAGLIALAIIEIFISIYSTFLCFKQIFGVFGKTENAIFDEQTLLNKDLSNVELQTIF